MPTATELAAYIVEEVVRLFDGAQADGLPTIASAVGSRFEARARVALAALEADDIYSEVPEIPDYVHPRTAATA